MRPPRPAAAAPAGLSPGRRLRGPRPERRGAHVAALRGGARGWPRSGGSAEGRPGSAGPGDGARGDQLPVETPAVAPEQRARGTDARGASGAPGPPRHAGREQVHRRRLRLARLPGPPASGGPGRAATASASSRCPRLPGRRPPTLLGTGRPPRPRATPAPPRPLAHLPAFRDQGPPSSGPGAAGGAPAVPAREPRPENGALPSPRLPCGKMSRVERPPRAALDPDGAAPFRASDPRGPRQL